MNRLTAFFILCLCILSTAGCVRTEVGSTRRALGEREKAKYDPIRNHKLKLELTGNGQLFSGEGGRGVQTVRRVYLYNHESSATSMVDDTPTESRLHPAGWKKLPL
mgnify:CR=1 FL=1